MEYIKISNENREQVNNFIIEQWLTTEMIICGKIIDMTKVDGIAVYNNLKIIGLITYIIKNFECEITSIDSLIECQGIGTELINKVIQIAKQQNCKRVKLITTNDNINAIKFYQKHGFDMINLYYNALDISRKLKPEIPLIGQFGILLKHEIEFEYKLI